MAGTIKMVRSPGGSPAWALVESARGHFAYINLWSKRAAKAYDLAAAVLILRRAGGDVVAKDGTPVNALNHGGPFIAALDARKVEPLCALVQAAGED